MEPRDRLIVAQVAYKIAGQYHAAEVADGASFDAEHLHNIAKQIGNGIFKLAGSPSSGEAGGTRPREEVSGPPPTSSPSCPRCDAPMERNPKWEGPGDKKPKWRCSQRGRFVKDRGWDGCNGAKWEDAA